MKKKDGTRSHIDKKTIDSSIRVHLTWTDKGNQATKVSGYLIDAKIGVKLDDTKTKTRTANGATEIELAISEIVADFNAELFEKKAKREVPKKELIGKTDIEKAYYEVLNSRATILDWRESTSHNALVYFGNNILSEIRDCECSADFSRQDLLDLRLKIMRSIEKNGNSNGDQSKIEKGANDHLRDAQAIYNHLRSKYPGLPDLTLDTELHTSYNRQQEQVRCLTLNQNRDLCKRVEAEMMTNAALVRAAAIMISGGARSAEAAAITPERIDDHGDYLSVWILGQELNGNISPIPKTDDSYRVVILDEWGTYIVKKCNELLVESDNGECAPVSSKVLSTWLRNLMEEVGCSAQLYADTNAITGAIGDIAAHCLRRNRASIWRNYCGLIQGEIDYLLGHKSSIRKFEKGNPKISETLDIWARKISRFDLFPDLSKSPKHSPISLRKAESGDFIQFDTYRIKNDTNQSVSLEARVEAAEMGEQITFEISADQEYQIEPFSKPSGGKRRYVEIIGKVEENEG